LNIELLKENFIKGILFLCAASSIGLVFFMLIYMMWIGQAPFFEWIAHGFAFLMPYMVNTMYIGLGGTLIGAVIGIPCAIYLAEFANFKLRNVIKPALEVLNGFPSIIMGLLVYILVCDAIVGRFTDKMNSVCILAGWIVLGIMSLPLIVSVSEDSLRAVPHELREASFGLGATKWQTSIKVLLPSAISGISSSIVLALLNAVGETMAVISVIGNFRPPPITLDPLSPSNVLTTMIANSFGEAAWGSYTFQRLFAAGAVLFIMTAFLNIAIRIIKAKMVNHEGK
jgi:ABC-type phosphate transport system permease subunit